MTCPSKSQNGESSLVAFAAGRLQGSDKWAIAEHTRSCETCAGFVKSQSAVWDLLDEWEPAAVSRGFDRLLYARIEETRAHGLWARAMQTLSAWVARPALPLTAVTLVLAAGIFVDRGLMVPSHLPEPAQPAETITPGDADQLNTAFDDLLLLHQLDVVKDEAPDASHSL